MAKTKSHRNKSDTGKDTKEARLAAAQYFVKGDRVRHFRTGALGIFIGLHDGFALPETWVAFDSDTDSRIPVSCNPLDLELAQKDCSEHKVLRELGMLGDTQLPNTWHNGLVESNEQTTDETPALIDEATVAKEELAAEATDPKLEAGSQTITAEVSEMADTVDDTPQAEFEVVEELTEEELAERHRLELKVERAFYEAGLALKELKERKLFRSTHRNFDVYCRDRFRFSRDKADLLIKAVGIVDNLKKSDNCRTFLPTAESQVRDLVDLTPSLQCEIYAQAVEAAGDKVPSRRIVKGIVERLKEQDTTPPPIPYSLGSVVEIRAGCNSTLRKHDGCWGIVTHVGTWSCKVHISVRNVNVQCLPDEMDRVDPQYTASIRAVHQRISALMQRSDLSRTAIAVVETLVRQTCFSPGDLWLLEKIEEWYGL